jgi:hypothetical protein
MATKKTWQQKLLDSKDLPKVFPIPERLAARSGKGTMVIPAPIEVDEAMRSVKKGKLATIQQIQQSLASKHNATVACPITTGIFAWIAAHAAEEAAQNGKKRITPYWRTLKNGKELNSKYPGGIDNLKAKLEAEGHTIVQKGKRYFVSDEA